MLSSIATTVTEVGLTPESVTYVAAPIWDIGANLKDKGITFAVYLLMGGTALIAAFQYFVKSDKTQALKVLAIGVVLTGVVGALPNLGVISRDSVTSLTNTR